jgi:hypothetical protein
MARKKQPKQEIKPEVVAEVKEALQQPFNGESLIKPNEEVIPIPEDATITCKFDPNSKPQKDWEWDYMKLKEEMTTMQIQYETLLQYLKKDITDAYKRLDQTVAKFQYMGWFKKLMNQNEFVKDLEEDVINLYRIAKRV